MRSKLNVELQDGSVCHMAKKSFHVFLSLGRVVKFERADGWAVVGEDAMRDLEKVNDYPDFANRRATS
jgi:hypothetical protein